MVAIMGIVLVIALYLLHKSENEVLKKVSFDPKACVRIMSVGRVYRIREQTTDDTDRIWFCTDVGIRVLDASKGKWTRYGLDHGLQSEIVADVCFAEGIPWVATWNGIAQLDMSTNTFIPLDFQKGFAGSRVLTIQNIQDYIYFSIDNYGLYRLAPGDSLPEHIPLPGLKSSARISSLVTHEGTLLIGTEDRRVFRLEGQQTTTIEEWHFDGEESKETLVWDVVESDSTLYVATSNDGIWRRMPGDTLFRRLEGFPAKGAYTFAPENDGFWCGTPFGLYRFHAEDNIWIRFPHPDEEEATDFQVFTLLSTESSLWYGSMDFGAGLLRKDRIAWEGLNCGLYNTNIRALYADRDDLLVGFGYQEGTAERYDAQDVQFQGTYSKADNILEPSIQTFYPFNDRVYFGGSRSFGFMNLETNNAKTYIQDKKLPFGDVVDIKKYAEDTLILASLFGLIQYHPSDETFSVIAGSENQRATSIVVYKDRLWYGTLAQGVKSCEMKSGVVKHIGLDDKSRIMGLSHVGEGQDSAYLVIATKRDGLFRYYLKTQKILPLTPPGSVFQGAPSQYENHILTIRKIDDILWFGTREKGCLLYEVKTGKWQRYTYYEGLVSDRVLSLYDSKKYIWIGCEGGINRIDKMYISKIVQNNENDM